MRVKRFRKEWREKRAECRVESVELEASIQENFTLVRLLGFLKCGTTTFISSNNTTSKICQTLKSDPEDLEDPGFLRKVR